VPPGPSGPCSRETNSSSGHVIALADGQNLPYILPGHRDVDRLLARRNGLLRMEVYHLDELRVVGRSPLSGRARKFQLVLSAHEFLKHHSVQQRTLSPTQHSKELFSLDLPL